MHIANCVAVIALGVCGTLAERAAAQGSATGEVLKAAYCLTVIQSVLPDLQRAKKLIQQNCAAQRPGAELCTPSTAEVTSDSLLQKLDRYKSYLAVQLYTDRRLTTSAAIGITQARNDVDHYTDAPAVEAMTGCLHSCQGSPNDFECQQSCLSNKSVAAAGVLRCIRMPAPF